jgi:hypothetical protein
MFLLAGAAGRGAASAQTGVPANKAVIDDLIVANRAPASDLIGFLDTAGHVSVRRPTNPNHYYNPAYSAVHWPKCSGTSPQCCWWVMAKVAVSHSLLGLVGRSVALRENARIEEQPIARRNDVSRSSEAGCCRAERGESCGGGRRPCLGILGAAGTDSMRGIPGNAEA